MDEKWRRGDTRYKSIMGVRVFRGINWAWWTVRGVGESGWYTVIQYRPAVKRSKRDGLSPHLSTPISTCRI